MLCLACHSAFFLHRPFLRAQLALPSLLADVELSLLWICLLRRPETNPGQPQTILDRQSPLSTTAHQKQVTRTIRQLDLSDLTSTGNRFSIDRAP